jgi:hypothetical protein
MAKVMTIDNFEKVFFEKQTKLFNALKRQEQVFEKYVKELKNYPDFTKQFNFDFNLIHDLEDRLKDRIKDLQSEYYSLHWDKYQFNTY